MLSRITFHESHFIMGDIYKEPELYDAAHWWKTNDIEFISGWADKIGGPVLELAAGTGRLGIPILEQGHRYKGLESSPEYVTWAEKKLSSYGDRGQIIAGDMREFSLDQKFKFCFIGFNSLLHLLTNEEILSCFKSVKKHLVKGGKFLIDVFIPDPEFLYGGKNINRIIMEFEHPLGGHCIVREKNHYDIDTQINHIRWAFYREGQTEPELYEFDMHMIYPDTMDRLLTEVGFVIEEKFGDYDYNPLSVESDLQIYLGRND